MKTTKEVVESYVGVTGCEPVQIDGIPEGFSFKRPDLTVGKNKHVGDYIAFIPLSDPMKAVWSPTIEGVLELYNEELRKTKHGK